jgi:hypothetical protein
MIVVKVRVFALRSGPDIWVVTGSVAPAGVRSAAEFPEKQIASAPLN